MSSELGLAQCLCWCRVAEYWGVPAQGGLLQLGRLQLHWPYPGHFAAAVQSLSVCAQGLHRIPMLHCRACLHRGLQRSHRVAVQSWGASAQAVPRVPDAGAQVGNLTHGQRQHSLHAGAATWDASHWACISAAVQSLGLSAQGLQRFMMLGHCMGYRAEIPIQTGCMAQVLLLSGRVHALHMLPQGSALHLLGSTSGQVRAPTSLGPAACGS